MALFFRSTRARIILFITALLFGIFYMRVIEKVDPTIGTVIGWDKMLAIENIFTGLKCFKNADPTVPIARFRQVQQNGTSYGQTYECVSLDGNSCATRSELGIPEKEAADNGKQIQCSCPNGKENCILMPDFIRAGILDNARYPEIRNVLANSEKHTTNRAGQYDYFPNMKRMICIPEGLADPTHWCGKLYKAHCIDNDNNDINAKAECEAIKIFKDNVAAPGPVVEFNRKQIAQAYQKALEAQNALRGRKK